MALTEKLTNIANGFRASRGTTDKYTLDEMAVLAAKPTGGGDIPEEAFVITGDCNSRFAYNGWNWFIDTYGDKITTKDITDMSNMFMSSPTLTAIPFIINISDVTQFSGAFSQCKLLTECPKIRGTIKWSNSQINATSIVNNCHNLRYIDDLFSPEMFDGFSTVKVTSPYTYPNFSGINSLYSLRKMPEWFYKLRLNEESTVYPASSIYNFGSWCSVDELIDIPVWRCNAAQTSNMFTGYPASFEDTYRTKDITFETDNGTPIVTQWKSQTMDLTTGCGYVRYKSYSSRITDYNSGITADKEVKDDATYQALKDDPDWFTIKLEYSRYNHDSAVNTINSLPDTSAYLATAGGTNTIKFKGTAGSNTDGGAINTLTEEEIAVATAKGWTVTFA